jgi:hypothetical protein
MQRCLMPRCPPVDTALMGADRPDHPGIAAHIESISSRARPDADRLTAAICGDCWPGGIGDRTQTIAREWIRRWGPCSAGAVPPACRCAVGHCGVCN